MPHTPQHSQPIRGVVIQFNFSPKGVPEGIILRLIQSGEIVQINFDPELAGSITSAVTEGQTVTIDGHPSRDAHAEAGHNVFDLVRLSNESGGSLIAEGPAELDVFVQGKVVRLNHARRGEVNGAILDTGDFVHLKPHGVKAIGGVTVGETLEARGEVRAGWSGHRVIEARSANGVDIGKPPHKSLGPKHGSEQKPLVKTQH